MRSSEAAGGDQAGRSADQSGGGAADGLAPAVDDEVGAGGRTAAQVLLGTQLRALAAQVLSDDTVDIDAVLRALQQRLGQAVHLAVLSGDHATYTHKVDPGYAYRIATEVGTRLPLHASAAGKVLLAHLPEAETKALLDRTGLPARTSHTVTDRTTLLSRLETVRHTVSPRITRKRTPRSAPSPLRSSTPTAAPSARSPCPPWPPSSPRTSSPRSPRRSGSRAQEVSRRL
ncbi:IclR family transcriptional regulator C-terminal domain-containing protein [Streptomyces sp. NPDC005480]|uniref:IclR family transcriptional regulator n=1 Tax=Streptomyces sp. NPDC005480 TaxID=3154880 RepID=UPI0033AF460E